MASTWTRRAMEVAVVFATLVVCIPAFAQTGGLTGKCVGENRQLLAGYTVQVERKEVSWVSHVKTNKKGEYTIIGLAPGIYKATLQDPEGKDVYYIEKKVGVGDPVTCDFDLVEAKAEAQKAAESDPNYQKQQEEQKQSTSLKQLFDQGRELNAQKRYGEAAQVFEKALPLAKAKNVPVVLSQLADTWSKAANAETNPETKKADQAKALDYYAKALEVNPNDAGLHNNTGTLYADMGKPAEAVAEFKKAAELDPAHAASYYYNLGAIMVNRAHMDEAAEALKKATEIDPNYANAWYWYGMALMGKMQVKPDGTMVEAPGTIEAFQAYLKLAPNGPFAEQAQASIDSFSGKQALQYKAPPKPKK